MADNKIQAGIRISADVVGSESIDELAKKVDKASKETDELGHELSDLQKVA